MNKLKSIFTAVLLAASMGAAASSVSTQGTGYESGAVSSSFTGSLTISESAKSEWLVEAGIGTIYVPYLDSVYSCSGYSYYSTCSTVTFMNWLEVEGTMVGLVNLRDLGEDLTMSSGIRIIFTDYGNIASSSLGLEKKFNDRLSGRVAGSVSFGAEDTDIGFSVGGSLRLFSELYLDIDLGLSSDNSVSSGLTYKF